MNDDPHSPKYVFGTALDLCEDIFLGTFDKLHFSLLSPQGDVIEVDAALPNSSAKLLLKTSAFESTHISMCPDEAGSDGKWLKQMGSSVFRAADLGFLLPDWRGRSTGEELERILSARIFHTLPIFFERSGFVIAHELPPWSNDLLDGSYLRNVWHGIKGAAICLSDPLADAWRKSQTDKSIRNTLHGMLSDRPAIAMSVDRKSGGRPGKLPVAMHAYQELGLADEKLTRKEELRRLETHLGIKIGLTTVDRIRRVLKSESATARGDPC